ncbi:MAG: hypothetical protein HRU11_14800, partial [Parvularculaceae bacterium]|nr:hypothetical protein [Parvularculaceae bacterium]
KQAPSLDDARDEFERELGHTAERLRHQLLEERERHLSDYRHRKAELVQSQRRERQSLKEHQTQERLEQAKIHQAAFRKGLAEIWDRLRGHHRKISKQNEAEALATKKCQTLAWQTMIDRQLNERRRLRVHQLTVNRDHVRERTRLERSLSTMMRGLER